MELRRKKDTHSAFISAKHLRFPHLLVVCNTITRRMKALQSRYQEMTAGSSINSHLNYSGSRLRAHASALRADLIREAEDRLLTPVTDEACLKPIRLYVPPSSLATAAQATATSLGTGRGSVEEDTAVAASCVLSRRGELLVADHSDEGLNALRPRSLGFIAADSVLPPQPEPLRRGQTRRRYPVVLMVSRTAHRRCDGFIAGQEATLERAVSDANTMSELRLFAPSLNQYDALRHAIQAWSAGLQPALLPSLPVPNSSADEDKKSKECLAEHTEELILVESFEANESLPHVEDRVPWSETQTTLPSSPVQPRKSTPDLCPRVGFDSAAVSAVTYGSEAWAQTLASAADISAAQLGQNQTLEQALAVESSAAHNQSLEQALAMESPAAQLRKQIATLRQNLLQTISRACITQPPKDRQENNLLLATAAMMEEELHDTLAATVAAAANLRRFPLGTYNNKGCNDILEDDSGVDLNGELEERGRHLTMQLELRTAAAGLLAGLDAALVLEIHHFAEENARLRARLRQRCTTTFSSRTRTAPISQSNDAAARSAVLLVPEPDSPRFTMVTDCPYFRTTAFVSFFLSLSISSTSPGLGLILSVPASF